MEFTTILFSLIFLEIVSQSLFISKYQVLLSAASNDTIRSRDFTLFICCQFSPIDYTALITLLACFELVLLLEKEN